LNTIIAVLTQNILPIFIVATFGFSLQRWVGLDKRTLSSVVMNILSPCLVFSSLVSSPLPGEELAGLALFTILSITTMSIVGLIVARLFRLSRIDTIALLIVLMFVNGGNYGLTLNQLRYGNEGLARAIVYFTTSTVVLFTAGIFIASMGALSWPQALGRLIRFPAVYAAILAIIVYRFNISLPAPLLRSLEVAGAGAIPVMLLVLGMQMADTNGRLSFRLAAPAILVRLLLGPLVGLLMATLIGLQGLGRSTAIIEASMPPAVFTIILATEFDIKPTAVTNIVVLSTLLSPLTLASTIAFLGL
jgi:predicted permease